MKILIALLLVLSASAQTIKTAHPRLLLDDARLAELRAKRVGTPAQQAQWNDMIAWINSNGCATPGNTNIKCGPFLALAYQVDHSLTAYADQACALMYFHTNSSDGPTSGALWDDDGDLLDNDSPDWYGTSPYLMYDWAFDRCTDAQKTAAKVQFQRFWTLRSVNSPSASSKKFEIYSDALNNGNHSGGQMRALFAAAIATHEEGTFDNTAVVAEFLAVWRAKLGPCFNNNTTNPDLESCSGGGWGEGNEYVSLGKVYAQEVMDMLTIGTTDINLWAEAPTQADVWMKYQFANTSPTGPLDDFGRTRYQPWQTGDVSLFDAFGQTQRDYMMRLASTLKRSGDTQRAAWIQGWLKEVDPFGRANSNTFASELRAAEFLYYDPEAASTDYVSVSPELASPFLLMGRSDLTANATWVGFTVQPSFARHGHGDSGSMQIYRKGAWLMANILGYATNAPAKYLYSTPSHSGRSLNWRGTKVSAQRGQSIVTEWSRMGRTPAGGYKSVCGALYCYAQGDIGGEYRYTGYNHTPDVETATRDFLYLKPDLFVVADRVKYVAGVNAATISHFQTNDASPTISGNRATSTVGNQKMHINVVYPATAQITPVKNNLCMVMGAAKLSNDAVNVSVDCRYQSYANPVVISGITGEWAVLNGTWTYTVVSTRTQTLPYTDGVNYNGERLRITSTGAFASITGAWPIAQSGVAATAWVKDVQYKGVPVDRWRIDVQSGQYANTDAQLVVMEAADDTATPLTTANYSTTDWQLAGFGGYVAGSPKAAAPVLPVTYSFDPGAATTINHYLLGLTPSTSYGVTVGSGTVTVAAGGTDVATTAEGVLYFNTTGGAVALSVTTASLPDGILGTTYSTTLSASGGTAPRMFSIVSGALPAGLTLSGATISGIPTAAGTNPLTVRVTDAASATADRSLSINLLSSDGTALAIDTTSLPSGTVGSAYTPTYLVATGGETPYVWTVQSGTICAGLTLSTAGLISGTPAQAETCAVTYRVTDSALSVVDKSLSITTVGTSPVSVAVERRGTSAIVTLRGAMRYSTSCTVTAGASSAASASGPAVRRLALVGLTPGTAYTFLADCGASGNGAVDAAATAAVSGTTSVPISLPCSADVTVNYGLDLASTATATHSAGRCSVTLSLPAGTANSVQICRSVSNCGAPTFLIP